MISPDQERVLVRVFNDPAAAALASDVRLQMRVLRRFAERSGRMIVVLVAIAVALAACVMGDNIAPTDDPPTCASLGCPVEPSGTPDIWTECTTSVCWCWGTGEMLACERDQK